MEEIKKSKRGGARPGAGRKKKAASAIVPRAASAFEAGDRHSLNRGFLLINTVDPRRELTGATRQEVMRQVRDLYNNDPRATYIIEHIAQRAVGTGIVPQAKSKNRVWNRQAERHFEDMVCQEAFAFDAAGAVNFYGAQSLILRQVAVDGDFFGQLVKSLSGMGMMRFIGAESVQGDEAPYFDGVELGFFGRPAAYRVVPDLSKSSDAVRIPAEDILHFRHVRRAGYTRGVSWLHAAVLDVRDGKEIKTFVKGSYKLASQMGLVITSGEGFKIGSGSEETPVADGISTETVYNGTLIPKLKPGEKLETLKNEHPGQNFDPLMRYLVSAVAFSAGIPPESVMTPLQCLTRWLNSRYERGSHSFKPRMGMPKRSMFFRVRGCTGNTTGIPCSFSSSTSSNLPNTTGSSTLDGLCSVMTMYPPSSRPASSHTGGFRNRSI